MFLMDSLIRRCTSGVPPELDVVAQAEDMDPARLSRGIACGRIVVPFNPARNHKLCAIGEDCTVKVNVNVGTSGSRCDPALEEEKAKAATCERRRCLNGPLDRWRPCCNSEKDARA